MKSHLFLSSTVASFMAIALICSSPVHGGDVKDPCVDRCDDPSRQRVITGIEPGAGQWMTWIIPTAQALRVAAPPSMKETRRELEGLKNIVRDTKSLVRIRYWDAGAPGMRWLEIAIAEAAANKMTNNRAARVRALLNLAIYDATIATWDSKYAYLRPRPGVFDRRLTTVITTPDSPSYPSEHAAVAGAAATVLSYLFPADADSFREAAARASASRLEAGVQYRSDVTAGLALGETVGAMVVDAARQDGSDAKWTGRVPNEKGKWNGTNPVDPLGGTWKTYVLSSGSQLRPGPPPAFDSEQEAAELAEVRSFPRTFATNEAAMYWQGPRFGNFLPLTTQKIAEVHLDSNPPRAARAYALMSVANYDATVACWDAKYTYWAIRPSQLDATVSTLFAVPNHPSYPSAHGCNSGAATEILSYLFPADADSFRALAQEAANSRMWAGIHFRTDDETGLALGRAVAKLVITRAENDGSR